MNYNTEEEVWKDVKGYEGYYQVSNLGRVRSVDRVVETSLGYKSNRKGKMLKPGLSQDGYELVVLSKGAKTKPVTVHKLVAEMFLVQNDSLYINHKNGVKTDNSVSNLEYVTFSENMQHSFDTGLRKNKITAREANEIRDLYANTSLTQPEIGKIYGISKQMVSSIWVNKKWK